MDRYFQPIVFNPGLNVVFASIKKPKEANKDSHNLGKTLLIDVIDFCLLKKINDHHFTKKIPNVLKDIIFYLELEIRPGSYVTIRRSVSNNTKISLKNHTDFHCHFTCENEKFWNHYNISFEKSKEILNSYLAFEEIKPFDFRKGLTYFLRKQKDYLDVFQIEKFNSGQHSYWKPYIAKLLGIDSAIIQKKYQLDNEIQKKIDELENKRNKVFLPEAQYDEIKARIELKNLEIESLSKKIDNFSFVTHDLNINEELVDDIESKISYLNNEIYNLSYEKNNIEESLKNKINFNISDIEKIFKDINFYFEGKIKKDYEELLDFNKKITKDRSSRLKLRQNEIKNILEINQKELELLDAKRSEALQILREKDSLIKYKKMNKKLVEDQADVLILKNQLKELDELSEISAAIVRLKENLSEIIQKIDYEYKKENFILSNIRSEFSRIIKEVLGVNALLFVRKNNNSNLEFETHVTSGNKATSPTAEGEGTSYKKMLCAAFDLAVINNYKNTKFYNFIYHDGIFEGLDNRKKIKLWSLIKDYCVNKNVQYIFTIIESDLPRNEFDEKIYFQKQEIILQLSDEGASGRLFKCEIF